MANEDNGESGCTVIDTVEGIKFAQLCAIKGAVKLECAGMHRRGRSACSIAKQLYGLKGSKAKVLAQLEKMVENILKHREAGEGVDHG